MARHLGRDMRAQAPDRLAGQMLQVPSSVLHVVEDTFRFRLVLRKLMVFNYDFADVRSRVAGAAMSIQIEQAEQIVLGQPG